MKPDAIKTYKQLGYIFGFLLLLTFWGFYKSYFGILPKFKANNSNPFVIHFHAILAFSWLIILIIQAFAIRFEAFTLHRVVGKISYIVAPLLIISFLLLIISFYFQANLGSEPISYVLQLFYFQIMHILFFTLFYALGLYFRRDASRHAAFMIATGFIFINPILRRVFGNGLSLSFTVSETIAICITDLLIISLMVLFRSRRADVKVLLFILSVFMCYHIPMLYFIYVLHPGI